MNPSTKLPTDVAVLEGQPSVAQVSDQVADEVLARPLGRRWLASLALAFLLTMVLFYAITYLIVQGVGIWGVQVPVAWGYAIANFVWWIGIGHAGTFISAFLLLLHQEWRTSINRFAEAMTLFAVACAGLFPLLHLGRPWFFYWLFPYPNTMALWPQFRSPLMWDVFAVSTYLLVSLVFWYVGLLPDVATLRDRAGARWKKISYGILALGWRNEARHWQRFESAYLILAGLAAPLVISVHSVVGMDFTGAITPGWHSTILPPYFVAGAIFSGFAMVLTLAIPLRHFYRLQNMITLRHLENCAKLLLVTGWIVAYSYLMEAFMAWYGRDPFDRAIQIDRALGHYASAYWLLVFCNVLVPQVFWSRRARRNEWVLFIASVLVNIGMWTERYVIVVTSLHHEFMPDRWRDYAGTAWDRLTLLGTMGFFLLCFLLFVRLIPVISISEMRKLAHEKREGKE